MLLACGPTNCFRCPSVCRAPRGARRVLFFPPRAPSARRLFLPATRSGRVGLGVAGWGVAGEWRSLLLLLLCLPLLQLPLRGVDVWEPRV
ncbi:unnamed protein product [Closterium sp. NIES-53]